jgi:CRISPR-associated protein Csb3
MVSIRINVDPANPGQFFACCGLLELADRLWQGGEAWFSERGFFLRPVVCSGTGPSLGNLVSVIATTPLRQLDLDDDFSSPVEVPTPFNLRLDWWKDDRAGGDRLKVWAGSMRSVRIARAMQSALQKPELQNEALLDYGMIVYDPLETDNKVEPFYFDARRGSNAQAIDVGFSTDSLQMTSVAYPAVEFLCLIGLQRFRPKPTDSPREFDYYTWEWPLAASVAQLAVCGSFGQGVSQRFRFQNAFRTDQRKHKAFSPATQL